MVGLWAMFGVLWFIQSIQTARLLWRERSLRSNAFTAGQLRGAVNSLCLTAVVFLIATIYMVSVGF